MGRIANRKVRFEYPSELLEIARVLSTAFNKRTIAAALSVPLSSIYRWLEDDAVLSIELLNGWTQRGNVQIANYLENLLGACEKHGIHVREAVTQLLPNLFGNARDQKSFWTHADERSFYVDAPPDRRIDRENEAADDSPFASTDATGFGIRDLDGRLARVKNEIDHHYYQRWSSELLAQLAGLTKFHFIRSFSDVFGVTPHQYLTRTRVQRAKHMLMLTRQPLYLIAASVGFSSPSSFARAFKRWAGTSPAIYFRSNGLSS